MLTIQVLPSVLHLGRSICAVPPQRCSTQLGSAAQRAADRHADVLDPPRHAERSLSPVTVCPECQNMLKCAQHVAWMWCLEEEELPDIDVLEQVTPPNQTSLAITCIWWKNIILPKPPQTLRLCMEHYIGSITFSNPTICKPGKGHAATCSNNHPASFKCDPNDKQPTRR